jgi:predicted O-methyltransferase YrrM
MNETIERIWASGRAEDAAGVSYPNIGSSISREGGRLLYDVVRALRPLRTLEIGMAYGLSTLHICQALHDNECGDHTVVDPLERRSYHGVGLANIERAGLSRLLRYIEEPSDEALPRLHFAGERFDFAFIDGNHRFDHALVDLFYIDKMLPNGAHVAVDDLAIAPVRKAVAYMLRNAPYRVVRPTTSARPTLVRHVLRFGRRLAQDPIGRDWRLKLVPHNVVLLRKTEDSRPPWYRHRAF